MAYGQRQVFVASPQPGTSNQPYPVGKLPPFVPVTVTVTDNYAAAVAANVKVVESAILLLSTTLGNSKAPLSLVATLSAVNESLARMADRKEEMARTLGKLSTSTGGVATAKSTHVAITSMVAANQIATNNFYQAAMPDKPVMKPLNEQIETSIKNGISMESLSKASGAVIGFVNDSIATVGTWITGSKAYQTVDKWISDSIDGIGAQITSSAKSILATIKGGL